MNNPDEAINKHAPSNLFAHALLEKAEVTLVKHMNFEGDITRDNINYKFFKRGNSFLQIPFPTHRFVATKQPDLVLVQGFIFPMQVMFLRKKIGSNAIILLQHHGESPGGKKKMLQKFADRYINGYLFSAAGNADPWLQEGIIKNSSKCFELPSSSTSFARKDKEKKRLETGMGKGINFLWVGRLNANKDPLTVLKGFEKYCVSGGEGFFSMIYNDDEMLAEIKSMIAASPVLSQRTKLIGPLPHPALEKWYGAADYFISGSWNEGGSYALTEAMACGCVPIVTKIPSAMKAIENGKFGFYFEPGDYDGLATILSSLDPNEQESLSIKAEQHFQENLSAKAVAKNLVKIYGTIRG